MELTPSLVALLEDFVPVFTTPTFTTFVPIATGWLLSQRHLFITEIILAHDGFRGGGFSRPVGRLSCR